MMWEGGGRMDWANLGLPCLLVRPHTNIQFKEGLRIPYWRCGTPRLSQNARKNYAIFEADKFVKSQLKKLVLVILPNTYPLQWYLDLWLPVWSLLGHQVTAWSTPQRWQWPLYSTTGNTSTTGVEFPHSHIKLMVNALPIPPFSNIVYNLQLEIDTKNILHCSG